MNRKILTILLLATVVIILGVSASFGYPAYLKNMNEVYGNGSCSICHENGPSGGPRTSYGTLFEGQPNHADNASAAIIAIGQPPTTATNMTNIPDVDETNENETNATEIAIEAGNFTPVNTVVETATPVVTTIEPTVPVSTTKPSPGFGIVMSVVVVLSITYLFGKRR
ncbi:MAG: hypothetical protein OIN87_12280 [Candidatus Methanoperedens sp.]|nr:hypothetical protein [Candidatus Methanoperedens sp.]